MIINIIKYIENHLIDDELFFHIPDVSRQHLYVIYWSKKQGRNKWQILERESQNEWHLTTSDLIAFLQTKCIDMEKLEEKFTDTIVNQVVMAKLLMEEARKLYGDEVLNSYVASAEQFYTSLLSAVSEIVNKKSPNCENYDSLLERSRFNGSKSKRLRIIN